MSVPDVLVRLLGDVSTRRGDELVPLPGARSRSVLAALAVRPGRSRTAHALIEDVWSDSPPRSPMNALHTQVSRLRAALPDGVLEIGPAGYRLLIDPSRIDLTLARAWERRAAQLLAEGSPRRAVDLALDASALWSGTPGADLPEGDLRDDLVTEAQRCRASLESIVLRGSIEDGDHETALPLAVAACEARDLDEPAHLELMRALHGLGRTNEALSVYAGLRARLADRLGSDPSPRISALHADLLRGDSAPRRGRQSAAPGVPAAIGIRASPNPLVGREDDIDAIEDMTRRFRVTTILGPGGTGKTRVAHEIGARSSSGKAGGRSSFNTAARQVTLVELASLRSGDDVVTTIGATLGVSESDMRYAGLARADSVSARARVRESLAARPMLLVLDNCEHVIADVADIVADLTAASPGLTVLSTSRAPMAITAESVYLLPPLAVSAATELFTSRARAVRPTVRIDAAEVIALCRRLDGLPLAIELAAAKVRTMSVEEISVRLAQRFALLKTGDPTSPARHRTLRAVIEWSWNLLDESQQIALRRLCRFPAGFTLSAAEAVAQFGAVDDVSSAIDGLVGQSMLSVVEDTGLRYHMLETVREYGEERLVASGEGDEVTTRTARWVTDLSLRVAADVTTENQLAAIHRIEAEHDNLVSALRQADSAGDSAVVLTVFPVLAFFWSIRGSHSEVMAWAPKILSIDITDPVTAQVPDDVLGTAIFYAAVHLTFGMTPRRLARARTTIRRTLRARPGMRPAVRLLFELSTLPDAGRGAPRLLATALHDADPAVRVAAYMARASLRENLGNLRGAERDGRAGLAVARSVSDTWSVSVITQNLGSILSQTGRFTAGIGFYEEAVAQLRELHAYEESMQVESYLCGAMIGAGRLDEARVRLADLTGGRMSTTDAVDPMQRNATLAMLTAMAAECTLAEGDTVAGLAGYRRAVDHAGGPDPLESPDPGTFVIISGAVAAHVAAGRWQDVREWIPRLATGARRRLGRGGIPDYPQIGCVAVAVGAFLIASGDDTSRGLSLLLLGIKARSRQDSPSLSWERLLADARTALGDERVAEGRAAVATKTRVNARSELLELLEGV
ncbi:SARP family transcriptional regulator [Rhodococcoides trifolii]|uniref:SARP family transcriptional regulator n=1 Tax=Rhodococcoides trifolii TaxID=908250 RepID=A0A917FR98_9NOCA|nr:BTAD domain-containing putative transcriptional regulator [Rhodococcus trifolii]GGF96050.1 SARP family transcriptional regulator [Rhodococcus trifolii]